MAAAHGDCLVDSSESNRTPCGGVLIPSEPAPWFRRRHYLLARDKTIVGRAPECQVRINHPSVSRNHLALEWAGGALVVSHLGSSNVTIVNGVPLTGSCALNGGDRIEIGDGIQFRLELFDNDDDAPTERRPLSEHRLLAIVHTDVVSYSRLWKTTPRRRPASSRCVSIS